MAKIIQIIDTDSAGHRVRLDDGHIVLLKHSTQGPPTIGSELKDEDFLFDHGKPLSIEQMNSDAQVQANVLSEIVQPHIGAEIAGFDHKVYPCGCKATGPGTLPDYCPEHGTPGPRDATDAGILAEDRAADAAEDKAEEARDERAAAKNPAKK